MLNNLGMGFVFTARDLASAKMSALEKHFASLDDRVTGGTERITGAFRRLGIGLGVFTAGAATVAGAFALADAAGRFEKAVAAVAAVSGATAAELEALKSAAIDAGIQTQFSPTEATQGLQDLAAAGFSAQESIDLLLPVLSLAAGSLGELSPQAAAGLASQAMKAFGIEIGGAAMAVDQMLQAVNVFALNANELPIALGTASRGAQALDQSLAETLVTLGLVKNVIPGVERAATATAVAMERLADPRVQARLRGIGVAVVDNQGGFRSFLDILDDLAPALDRMTDAQRSAFLLGAFGRQALGAVNSIMTQVTNGIRTSTGETVKGARAIAYLRQQFQEAGGTAADFASKMLDTFTGQKQLLAGSIETLAIVMGEPFARVLRPVVATVVEAFNGLLRFFRGIPTGMKNAIAAFTTAAGAIVAIVGAAVTAKAGIALLAIGLKVLGITIGGIVATLLPAILVVALLGAAVAGLVIAFRKNLGGIADFVERVGERVRLCFGGLKQLFEQGGFSGAVREELNRAENLGIKQFAIRLQQVAYRIQQVWEGSKEGFTGTIEEARPVFEGLKQAFGDLGNEIAALFSGAARGATGLPSAEFRSFGQIAGSAIGTIAKWLAKLVSISTRITSGIVSGFRSMSDYVAPAFATIGGALVDLMTAWNGLTGATDASSEAVAGSVSGWKVLGEVLGKVVGGAVTVLALGFAGLLKIVRWVVLFVGGIKDAFVGAGTWIGETAAKLYLFFTETLPSISSSIDRAIGDVLVRVSRTGQAIFDGIRDLFIELLRLVPDSLLPSSLERMKNMPLSTEVRSGDGFTPLPSTRAPAAHAEVATSSMPAIAGVTARIDALGQLEAAMQAQANVRAQERSQVPPFTVNVQVDGETVARAVNNAQQSNASRAFSPVPVY